MSLGTAGASSSNTPTLGGATFGTTSEALGGELNLAGGGTPPQIGNGGVAQGGVGASSTTSAPSTGVAGAANACDAVACAALGNACQSGACISGVCTLVNVEAGKSCEATRVCSGTGFCGDCVPTRGKCDGKVPSVCSAEGTWVAASACGSGDGCLAGTCISPRVEWALSATGDANAEIEDLAFMGPAGLVAALHAEAGTISVANEKFLEHTKVFTNDYPGNHNVALGLSRTTGDISWSLPLKSTDWAMSSRVSVATDTSFVHGFRYRGKIEEYTNPNSSGYGLFIRGYNAARAVQFTETFNPIDDSVGPGIQDLDAIVAQPNGAFLLFTYSTGLAYSIWDNPGTATLQESNAECATVLSRLNASGIPTWNKQFAWCTDSNRKVMKLGPTGDLYVAGASTAQNGLGPVPTLDSTTLKSNYSGVIARLRPNDGGVVKVVEFEGVGTSNGRVDDLAFLPDGNLVALVSASYYMTFKIGTTELPGGTYLVKLDPDLNLLKYQYLGTAISENAYVSNTRLAASANGVLYVAGTFVGDFDFGGGTFSNVSSCQRCVLSDAFIASYTSDFEHRWSRPIGSATGDNLGTVVAENGRAYVSVHYGATIMVDGTPYAPTATPWQASTLFAFAE